MSNVLQSTLLSYGEVIDCRQLAVRYDFYMLTQEAVSCMCKDIIAWISELLGDQFITRWDLDGRVVSAKKLQSIPERFMSDYKSLSFGCEGYVKSPLAHNLKTLRELRFEKKSAIRTSAAHTGLSVDYREYWNSLFPDGRPGDKEIVAAIHRLFSEDRHIRSLCSIPDLFCHASAHRYSKHPGQYRGSFMLGLNHFCLDGQCDAYADRFLEFACRMAERYKNLNAYVMLEPSGVGIFGMLQMPYKRYFGGKYGYDDSHLDADCAPVEWYDTYNLQGVEWANIISPLAQTHFESPIAEAPEVVVKSLPGETVLVRHAKPMSQYNVAAAKQVKQVLQPALYCGGSYIPLKELFCGQVSDFHMLRFPRCDWAIVPMLDGEIRISGNALVFSGL